MENHMNSSNITPLPASVWTFEDYTERRCMLSDVGHERYDPGYARRVAQRHTGTAIDALVAAVKQDDDLTAKIKAAQVILDRGWGRPTETLKADIDTTITIHAPWMAPNRLSYMNTLTPPAEVVEMAPIEPATLSASAPPPTPNDVAAARQSHHDAQYAARVKQKAIDHARTGGHPATPDLLVKASDILPPTPGDPSRRP
jgi:hypothetical protein